MSLAPRTVRRFGVVSSPYPERRDVGAACLRGLDAAGFGQPAWVVDPRVADAASAPPQEPVDFVLDLCGDLSSAIGVGTPAFGVWSFDVDEDDPTGWRAMAAGRTSVGARLCASLGDGARVVLQEGMLPISPVRARTRDALGRILATWPARAAADIESGGWDAMTRQTAPHHARATDRRPSRAERIEWALAGPWRRLRHWWRETARYDTWNVGIATLDRPLGNLEALHALGAIRWLPPQRPLYFLADPFPYRHDGRDWLLVEEYGHPKGVRGRISRVDVSRDTPAIEPVIVRNGHLSYPFTFAADGGVYCAAEMGAERDGCIIYQLGDGGGWAPRHHILRGRAIVDPTFVRAGDRWWLFCTDAQGAGSLVLHGFHADALAGPWTPHPLNPLKSDLSSARSAGRPFTIDGRLFRPAQDCSRTYGGAVNVMEIVELSPTRFRETRALRLEPDARGPYPDGLHHLVVDGTQIYIDAKRCRYDHLLWLKVWLARA